MSRRERRKAALKRESGAKRWLVRGAVAAFGGMVLLLGGGYIGLRSWLHGESFRDLLSVEAGKALEATSQFGSFQWGGTSMTTPSFRAEGERLVKRIDAEDLRVGVGLGGWWEGVWRIEDARVRRLEVEIDATAAERIGAVIPPPTAEPPVAPKARKWYDRFVPQKAELERLELGSATAKIITRSGPIGISGTTWRVIPDATKGSYRAEGSGGTVEMPWRGAPPMALGEARLRYHDDTVSLSSADFRVYRSGRLDLNGEMSLKGGGYMLDARLADVMCSEILPEDWKQRLTGKIDAAFTVKSGQAGPAVTGRLDLENGILTALPMLDALAAYADTTRFRRLALQEGRTAFDWQDGALTLSNLVIASEGLVRVEGDLKVDPAGALDGAFRLGIAPGVLARIPGAETIVFSPGERGLLWTTVRVTGTAKDPKEDLSGRLIEAAGLRMIEIIPETGEQVLKFTQKALDEDMQAHLKKGAEEVIGQGLDVIREAQGVVREVEGIFDILRGRDRSGEGGR